MATLEQLSNMLDRKLAPIKTALANERERDVAQRARFKEVLDGLEALNARVSDDATRTQVANLRQLVVKLAEPEATP